MDPTAYGVRDANLIKTKALPNGAAAVNSDGIDLGALSGRGARLAEAEFLLTAPALTTTELADTQTITYKFQHDDDAAFGSPTTLADGVIVQTGAGGAGAVGQTFRLRPPTNCQRYVRIVATKTGASNASTASLTFELLF